jgi:hypothetical protein
MEATLEAVTNVAPLGVNVAPSLQGGRRRLNKEERRANQPLTQTHSRAEATALHPNPNEKVRRSNVPPRKPEKVQM